MRIAYLGSGAFGLPTIQRLAAEHQLVAIATQPDKPAGRNKALTPTPIAAWAAEHAPQVPIFKPDNINDPTERQRFRAIEADAWVVIAYGQYLSTPLLADRFVFNLHASRLPRWRGAAPIHHAILAGDTTTGNSIITIARRMDAGDILNISEQPITPTTTTGELHDQLAADGPALVFKTLEQFATGAIVAAPQDEARATIAPKLSREDAIINFNQPVDTVRCQINGLSPWPGVAVHLNNQRLKLLRAAPHQPITHHAQPGTLIDANEGIIACATTNDATTAIQLLEVQPAGKTPQPWQAFTRGHHPTPGTTLYPIT